MLAFVLQLARWSGRRRLRFIGVCSHVGFILDNCRISTVTNNASLLTDHSCSLLRHWSVLRWLRWWLRNARLLLWRLSKVVPPFGWLIHCSLSLYILLLRLVHHSCSRHLRIWSLAHGLSRLHLLRLLLRELILLLRWNGRKVGKALLAILNIALLLLLHLRWCGLLHLRWCRLRWHELTKIQTSLRLIHLPCSLRLYIIL
mmetsp:Transcript_9875/g.17760  ORF Transcript_9875/g.17760 Transcript_9875/m.17760 type:complete len:201 (-) Transcript_9875:1442-2044(-)